MKIIDNNEETVLISNTNKIKFNCEYSKTKT